VDARSNHSYETEPAMWCYTDQYEHVCLCCKLCIVIQLHSNQLIRFKKNDRLDFDFQRNREKKE